MVDRPVVPRKVGVTGVELIIGPILKRAGGYVFDTWCPHEGLNQSYPYLRIEDASYARNVAIRTGRHGAELGTIACHTLDEFRAKTSGREVLSAA